MFCGLPKTAACGRGAGTSKIEVAYWKTDAKAPIACDTLSGVASIPLDGAYHFVTESSCKAPNNDTTFVCSLKNVPAEIDAECKMEGPKLYIKAEAKCPADGLVKLDVTVTNKETGAPIEGAIVTANPGGSSEKTDADGTCALFLAGSKQYFIMATAGSCQLESKKITIPGDCSPLTLALVLKPNDPCSDVDVGDPVNSLTGEFSHGVTDLRLPGKGGLWFGVRRTYRSFSVGTTGPFGIGWTSPLLQVRVRTLTNGDVLYDDESGQGFRFIVQPDGTFDCGCGKRRSLALLAGGGMRVTALGGDFEDFDSQGRLVRKETRAGSAIVITYSAAGFVVTDAGGRTVTFDLDAAGRIVRFRDPLLRETSYTYSSTGDLVEVRGPGSGGGYVAKYEYADHLLVRMDDPRAAPGQCVLRNIYEGPRVVEQELGTTAIRRWRLHYQADPSITTITDPAGRTTVHRYDDRGRIESITNAQGQTESTTWNSRDETPAIQVDALGRVTRYTYDTNGKVLTQTDPLGRVTTFTYDPVFHRVLTVTDANGRVTANTYDAEGNLASVSNPQGCACTARAYTYDVLGQMLTQEDANGHTAAFGYDAFGNRTSVTDALGQTTREKFDILGRQTKSTDALGRVTRVEYDGGDNPIRKVLPDGSAVTMTYDARGRRSTVTDLSGRVTRFEYDEFDSMSRVIDALGRVTSFEYDTENNLIRTTDANGNSTRHEYDEMNLRTRTIDALGRVTEYSRDAVGNPLLRRDAKGTITRYTFDALNQLIEQRATDGTWAKFAWDAVGNTTRMENNGAEISYTFDDHYRLREQRTERIGDHAVDLRLGYTYDSAGHRTSLTYPDGRTVRYELDPLNRPGKVILPDGSAITQEYTSTGGKWTRSFPNGLATTWKYDARDQVTNILTTDRHGKSMKSGVPNIEYGYDLAGNRISMDRTDDGKTAYRYDAINQLIEADFPGREFQRYDYDPAGNRVRLTEVGQETRYVYDAGNQLVHTLRTKPTSSLEDYRVEFAHDENGNTIRESASSYETTFIWDSENRLLAMEGRAGGVRASYSYDTMSRRQRIVERGATTFVVWSGNLPIYEQDVNAGRSISYVDLGGELVAELTYSRSGSGGAGDSKPLHAEFYTADAVGSVVAWTNMQGAVTKRKFYGPFGDPSERSGVGTESMAFIGDQGATTSRVTGLVSMHHRYYAPALGAFLSKDPLSGGLTDYKYALNNPLLLRDPSGLVTVGVPYKFPGGYNYPGCGVGAGTWPIYMPNVQSSGWNGWGWAQIDWITITLSDQELCGDAFCRGDGFVTMATSFILVPLGSENKPFSNVQFKKPCSKVCWPEIIAAVGALFGFD